MIYALFRRVDFRGKGRLRAWLPVPRSGNPVVGLSGGVRLRLDLRESLQRDFYFGLYDQRELRLVAERLERGGDFVDVGAHIGMYAVRAAVELAGRGRVLAFEPNPAARAQLLENLRINGCSNVVVLDAAAGAAAGRATLHVPSTADPSFSSLEGGRFAEGDPIDVEVTTVDDAVRRHGLAPAVVKIDVEGGEVQVLRGMRHTIDTFRPALLAEVSAESAPEVHGMLPGYRAFRVAGRRLLSGVGEGHGLFNVWFVPNGA